MKRLVVIAAAILTLGTISSNVKAGDNTTANHTVTVSIPNVILLDIEGGSAITLSATAPTEAGDPLTFTSATNSSLWLNYSSIVSSSTATRKITAKLSAAVPAGVKLTVTPTTPVAGTNTGTLGSAVGAVDLTTDEQSVITGIGSCYTGDGANNGSNLQYSLSLKDNSTSYANILSGDTPLTVTYTIEDVN